MYVYSQFEFRVQVLRNPVLVGFEFVLEFSLPPLGLYFPEFLAFDSMWIAVHLLYFKVISVEVLAFYLSRTDMLFFNIGRSVLLYL